MKLPIPQEILDALVESSDKMEQFGTKLDRVIFLLEKITENQEKQIKLQIQGPKGFDSRGLKIDAARVRWQTRKTTDKTINAIDNLDAEYEALCAEYSLVTV